MLSLNFIQRLSSYACGSLPSLDDQICLVRLPGREELYDQQSIPDMPLLAMLESNLTQWESANLGEMAHMVAIVSVWAEVTRSLYCTRNGLTGSWHGHYEAFYTAKQVKLQALIAHLPPRLDPSDTQKIKQALREGYIGSLVSLYAIHHMTHMALNRYVFYGELSAKSMCRNMKAAQFHAREILRLVHTTVQLHGALYPSDEVSMATFCTPLLACSISTALDILTSVGSLNDLESDILLVQSNLLVVQELGTVWATAQGRSRMIAVRFEKIMHGLGQATTEAAAFVATDPMDYALDGDVDLFFSPPLETRLRSLGLDPATVKIMTIDTSE
jgi:hypothetical protein